jgi:hypothetical protein
MPTDTLKKILYENFNGTPVKTDRIAATKIVG